jgi:hypothetical protein
LVHLRIGRVDIFGRREAKRAVDMALAFELSRGLDPEAAQQLLDLALHRMMDAVLTQAESLTAPKGG